MLCYWFVVACKIFFETVGYQVWCVLHLIVYIPQLFFWHVLYYVISPCIGSASTLGCVYLSSSYATMGVGFEFFIHVGDLVFHFLGSFTLWDAVVLGVLICLTSALVFAVSLWVFSSAVLLIISFPTLGNENWFLCLCVVLSVMHFPTLGNKNWSSRSYVVCLNISDKLLIACNFLDPMYANRSVCAGFVISSIKSSDVLVASYLLDIPGILFWSEKIFTVSEIRYTLNFLRIMYSICNVLWMVPNTTPLPNLGPKIYVALVFV